MVNLTQDEKVRLYNDMIMRYQRMQEEVRQIKAENFEVSDADQQKINLIETKMKRLFNDSQKLY
jgi:predicted DNA-binding WGR domain protein